MPPLNDFSLFDVPTATASHDSDKLGKSLVVPIICG